MILQAMQASGIPLPATTSPNAKLVSGGFLDIGTIALQSASSYLWLVGNETTVGAITAPSGARLLLQYSPSNPASAIGLEELPDTSQTVNYNNLNNIFPYPVTTLVIGSSLQTGDITIGSLGEVDLGSANIVAISTGGGQVDSLSNVITTGIVAGIQSASVFVTPTQESMAIEVEDPEYLDDDEERKKLIALADDGEGNSQMCAGQ